MGPSLAGIGHPRRRGHQATRVYRRGRTPEDYIRESILHPSAYVVPGPTFSAGGQSIMPAIYRHMLKPVDVDHLVAYLATLK